MLNTRQYNLRNLALLVLVLLIGLSACSAPQGPANGRLIYTNFAYYCWEDGQYSFFEYKEGMGTPAPLWTGIPCKPNSSISKWSISTDHHYAVLITDGLSLNLVLLNLINGDSKNLPLPDIDFKSIEINGAISPDNRFFVYSVNKMTPNYTNPWLYSVDLEKGTDTILYKNPCTAYTYPSGLSAGNVCATIGNPQWIDDKTIVFNGYSGDMPGRIGSEPTINPNRTLVIDLNGSILQEFNPVLHIGGIFGPTLLFYLDEKNGKGYEWLEKVDLKQGVINPHLLNPNSQFKIGHIGDNNYLEIPSISPDGQFAFQPIDGKWHLIGLRSGSDVEIHNTSVYSCDLGGLWSPDQKSFLCNDDIISLDGLADRKTQNASKYSLFAWLP
jgi:hypothetical protein